MPSANEGAPTEASAARPDSLVGYTTGQHRTRTLTMVLLLGLAGALEGLGVIAALPILENLVLVEGAEPSSLATFIHLLVRSIGLEPSLVLRPHLRHARALPRRRPVQPGAVALEPTPRLTR